MEIHLSERQPSAAVSPCEQTMIEFKAILFVIIFSPLIWGLKICFEGSYSRRGHVFARHVIHVKQVSWSPQAG